MLLMTLVGDDPGNSTPGLTAQRSSRSGLDVWTTLATLVFLMCSPPARAAAESDYGPVLQITEENDFVNGTDRWYTQGARIAYLGADNQVPRWMKRLLDGIPEHGITT